MERNWINISRDTRNVAAFNWNFKRIERIEISQILHNRLWRMSLVSFRNIRLRSRDRSEIESGVGHARSNFCLAILPTRNMTDDFRRSRREAREARGIGP